MNESLKSVLESLIFVSEAPLTVAQLRKAAGAEDDRTVRDALRELASETAGRGVQLVEVGGGWHLRTNPDHAPIVARFLAQRPARMSRAARETLAIVAYRQPVTRAEVEEIRGVDCAGVLKFLLERDLIRSAGHKEEPGRPLLYVTTRAFLELFHLRDLRDLPTLREFTELDEEHQARLEEALADPGARDPAAPDEPDPPAATA